MTQKSSKLPNFDAVYIRMRRATIHDSKYGTTHVLFANTYTAKQMKIMYLFESLTPKYHHRPVNYQICRELIYCLQQGLLSTNPFVYYIPILYSNNL